jgi:thiamine biosynthesis lipoprotein
MQRLEFRAMGCQMLAVVESEAESAGGRLAQVPGWFEVWEQRLSRFRPDSELSRVNERSGTSVALSPVLWEVCEAALEGARLTGGLVCPTMLDALEAAGYDRSFEDLAAVLPTPPSARPVPEDDHWTEIRLDRATRSMVTPRGVRLDLGGIVKGWAADRAARRLASEGPALVDAGGDVAVSGPLVNGQGWPIGVADPASDAGRLLETIALKRGGVATSGRDYRRWRRDGAWQHHILDPRTGRPAETDVVSATVIAPSAQLAETAAKTALILGSREGLAWLDRRPTLSGLLVLEGGRALRSRRWKSAERN